MTGCGRLIAGSVELLLALTHSGEQFHRPGVLQVHDSSVVLQQTRLVLLDVLLGDLQRSGGGEMASGIVPLDLDHEVDQGGVEFVANQLRPSTTASSEEPGGAGEVRGESGGVVQAVEGLLLQRARRPDTGVGVHLPQSFAVIIGSH